MRVRPTVAVSSAPFDGTAQTVNDGWPAAYDPSADATSDSFSSPIAASGHPGHRLGAVALIFAITAIAGTTIASAVIGSAEAQYATPQDGGYVYTIWPNNPDARALVIATLFEVGIGTVLGLWAIIQGIVAIVKNRGRLFAVLAILIALPGPFIALFVNVMASFP